MPSSTAILTVLPAVNSLASIFCANGFSNPCWIARFKGLAPKVISYPSSINLFLAENNAKKVVFIPFAAVTFSYDQYLENVQNGLDNNEIEITSIHQYEDKINAIKDADAIMVGGGNSFKLLNEVYENELLNCILAASLIFIGLSLPNHYRLEYLLFFSS